MRITLPRVLVGLVLASFLAVLFLLGLCPDDLDRFAKIGDFFGLLAFLGVLITLKLQHRQIELQQQEIDDNREVLNETLAAQREGQKYWKLEQGRIRESARLVLKAKEKRPSSATQGDNLTIRAYSMINVGGPVRNLHIESASNSASDYYSLKAPSNSSSRYGATLEYIHTSIGHGEVIEIWLVTEGLGAGKTAAKATLSYLNSLGQSMKGELKLIEWYLEFEELD